MHGGNWQTLKIGVLGVLRGRVGFFLKSRLKILTSPPLPSLPFSASLTVFWPRSPSGKPRALSFRAFASSAPWHRKLLPRVADAMASVLIPPSLPPSVHEPPSCKLPGHIDPKDVLWPPRAGSVDRRAPGIEAPSPTLLLTKMSRAWWVSSPTPWPLNRLSLDALSTRSLYWLLLFPVSLPQPSMIFPGITSKNKLLVLSSLSRGLLLGDSYLGAPSCPPADCFLPCRCQLSCGLLEASPITSPSNTSLPQPQPLINARAQF